MMPDLGDIEKKRRLLGLSQKELARYAGVSQSFIANLIPMGISDLFFFDGEKIQKLAEDTPNNGFFKEALDSILGLEVIQSLVKDLKIYAYKQNAAEDSRYITHQINTLIKDRDSLDNELANIYQERSSIRTKL